MSPAATHSADCLALAAERMERRVEMPSCIHSWRTEARVETVKRGERGGVSRDNLVQRNNAAGKC